jgi:hypothetical protein
VIRARLHRASRGVGAALALLTFASPLVGSWHEAAVRHVACPEHGELIDAPAQVQHQHAKAASDSPVLFAETDPAAPSDSGARHDHCVIVVRAQQHAREQSRSLIVVAAPDAPAAQFIPDEAPQLQSLALYRLAPKASPPLA